MRTIFSSLIPVLNDYDPDGAIIVLVAFFPRGTDGNEVYYFTTNNDPVDYPSSGDTHTYQPAGMQFEPEEENGEGDLSAARLVVANTGNVWTATAKEYRGFPNGMVIIRIVNTTHLNDTTSDLSQTFTIERHIVDSSQDVIAFDLKNWRLYKAGAPRERLYRNCQFSYKATRCGYSGSLSTCDHTLRGPNGCEFHDNSARFGGAPGLVRL